MKLFLLRFVACLFVVISSSSHAALYDRGNGLIYDDVLNITWLQDANYAQTSGYQVTNGAMTWAAANTWVDQLVYEGYEDWRLPSVASSNISGYNLTNGELGFMYYSNLGNVARTARAERNVSFTDVTDSSIKSFLNVQQSVYWYGNEASRSIGWSTVSFSLSDGYQFYYNPTNGLYAWAVHDGDIGAAVVPIPTTAWLFGSALAGLLVPRRKNKK
ncbi:hypothetical protein N9A51_01295 [Pseudomonadales bacterium]|nr:hypothetical protein [Pseudomonadales bacterium]